MKYHTLAEASAEARCNPATLRRAIHAGKLPAYKPGRDILIKTTDLDAWIKARQICPMQDQRLLTSVHPDVQKILKQRGIAA